MLSRTHGSILGNLPNLAQMTTSTIGTTYLKDRTGIDGYKSRSQKIEVETRSSNMQGMEFDSKLDSREDYDILEVLQGKEIQHWQIKNTLKKLRENLDEYLRREKPLRAWRFWREG
jgi:hypothetical protein